MNYKITINKILFRIGAIAAALFVLFIFLAMMRILYLHQTWFVLVSLLCPLMAYYITIELGGERKNSEILTSLAYLVMFTSIMLFATYLGCHSKTNTAIEKLFLSGRIVSKEVWTEEVDTDRGDIPEHYEKEYEFRPSSDIPDFILDGFDLGVLVIILGSPILTWRISKGILGNELS